MKLRPPGLVGSSIGILFISGLAMVISLFGVVIIAVNGNKISGAGQILIVLSFTHNAWVIFATVQALKMQRYAFAITAPLLVLGSWIWLFFLGAHIGLSIMGILGGISMCIWSLSVLRQPEVRSAFENQYDPLEAILPMARTTIPNQSPKNLIAAKGIFKQLLGSKIGLAFAGIFLLMLLILPFVAGKKVQKVSGSFQSIVGKTGEVSFGVTFSVPPKVTLLMGGVFV